MGDHRQQRWTTVGNWSTNTLYDRVWQFEREAEEQELMRTWDDQESWPSAHKPLFSGPDAKRFDSRLSKICDLGWGAFGSVEKVVHANVHLARKRVVRRRGFTIEDLQKEALTMRKLDHRHVVKIVATYAPRPHELCLLMWPAAVCNLGHLLDDIECLRQGEGDREDTVERLNALDLRDLSAIDPSPSSQCFMSSAKCPLEFLRTIIGCVARALKHCHENDVRHLDIKPSNILLKADRVYLADFGISRDVSGQDHTTTEGVPGTERWRAPELYSDSGSSMQLSDMYSLGLVYLNVATVLYNARLSAFDEALSYSGRQSREDQLKGREEKLRKHLDALTAHALVTPPFMFTYEGQETVRPRPLVNIIARMLASNPRNRLSAAKVDEKLSMLGGVQQIYHGDCCRQPIAWVEDKWDKKLVGLVNLREENERYRKKIRDLERKDHTYEQRIEDAQRAREDEVAALQARLKEMEEKCLQLEQQQQQQQPQQAERTPFKRGPGRFPHRTSLPTVARVGQISAAAAGAVAGAVGLGLGTARSAPTTPAARPQMQPSPRSSQLVIPNTRRKLSEAGLNRSPALTATPSPSPSPVPARLSTESLMTRSPSLTNSAGYPLRSRGSASKLPLRVAPNRSESLTDSSMASSVFSRRSVETVLTPADGSPALAAEDSPEETIDGKDDGIGSDVDFDQAKPQWGVLPSTPGRGPINLQLGNPRRRPSTPEQLAPPLTPVSATGSYGLSSAASSPRTHRSDLLVSADDATMTARMIRGPPKLKQGVSWAEVAKVEKALKGH